MERFNWKLEQCLGEVTAFDSQFLSQDLLWGPSEIEQHGNNMSNSFAYHVLVLLAISTGLPSLLSHESGI